MAQNTTVKLDIASVGTAKTTKDVKSLKEQIRDLRTEIQGLDKDTEEYNAKVNELGNLMHAQQEITEAARLATDDYGATLSNITSITNGVVGSLSAMNGVMNLIGASSDESLEAIRKMQSLMSIIAGLNQLDQAEKAFKGLWTRIKLTTTARQKDTQETIKNSGAATANAAATNIDAAAKRKDAVASGVATAANTTLATSFRNLGLAMKSFMMSNPFTLAIMGATALVSLITNIVNKTKEAAEEARNWRDEYQKLSQIDPSTLTGLSSQAGAVKAGQNAANAVGINWDDTSDQELKRIIQDNTKLIAEEQKKRQQLLDEGAKADSKRIRDLDEQIYQNEMTLQAATAKQYERLLTNVQNNLESIGRTIKEASGERLEELQKEYDDALKLQEEYRQKADQAYAAVGAARSDRNQTRRDRADKERQDADNAELERLKNLKEAYDLHVLEINEAYKQNEIDTQEYYARLIEAEEDYLSKYRESRKAEKLTVAQTEADINELYRKSAEERIKAIKAEEATVRGARAEVDGKRYQDAQNRLTGETGARYLEQEEELFNAWWLKKFVLIERYNQAEIDEQRRQNDQLRQLAIERYAEEENVLSTNREGDIDFEEERFINEIKYLQRMYEAKLMAQEEYDAKVEELQREHQERLREIDSEYSENWDDIETRRTETLAEMAEQRYNIEKEYFDKRLELEEAYISAYQTLSSSVGGILSKVQEQYAEGSRQYEKLQEANIIMDTVSGALSAFMSGVKSGIPAPGNFIYAGVLSALALAEGQLALNNLHSKKLSSGAANAPSVSAYQVVAQETGADLSDQIRDQRVYVTETDIAETLERVNVIETESTF